ncbi:hypothetical protein [Spirulina subsalsa]|uniref:hypothetical protein n=1 Tax=Spirulina subsalsa TaxID=54311 RepID=UPI00223764B2|nr:hypothetical protein [Spirulina subsalsa]
MGGAKAKPNKTPTSWADAMGGCDGRMRWADAMGGCDGWMRWADAIRPYGE